MKIFKIMLAITFCLMIFQDQYVIAQSRIFEVKEKGQNLMYRVTLPSDFDQSKSYPVLFAPGLEKKTDEYSIYIGKSPEMHGWIIVESIMHMKADFLAKALITRIRNNYPVEGLYFSGFSANSIDIFRLGAKYVKQIDGIIGMPGYANEISGNVIDQNPDLQIMLIVGERDTYWKSKAIKAHQKLQAMGANVSIDIIPNEGHIIGNFAGYPFFDLIGERIR